jgi:hypothetical protein
MRIQLQRRKTKNEERRIILQGLKNQANLFRLLYTPLETIEKNHNRINKFIMRNLLETIQKKDQDTLHF